MAIACPYCNLNIELTGVRAGRFSPRCPRCNEKFVLIIPPDLASAPQVLAINTSSQTHIFPALRTRDEQTTLTDESSGSSASPQRPATPTDQSTSSATSAPAAANAPPSTVTKPAEKPGLGDHAARPAGSNVSAEDKSVFSSKRGKYADWDDSQ